MPVRPNDSCSSMMKESKDQESPEPLSANEEESSEFSPDVKLKSSYNIPKRITSRAIAMLN